MAKRTIRAAKSIFSAVCFFLFALLVGRNEVQASAFYYEFQGGLGYIRNSDPFFANTPASLDRGFALNGSFGYSFSGGAVPAEGQIGIQYRTVTGSVNAMDFYALQGAYLIARVQLSRIFAGAGFAPMVWRRASPIPGLDSFSGAQGSYGYLGEGGVLWPVTPQFSLGGVGAVQMITTNGVLSPKPIMEFTLLMRVYFGFSKSSSSGSSKNWSNEFHGWRYPFGNELRGN